MTTWLTPAEAGAWRGYRRMRALLDLRLGRDLAADSGLSEPDYDVLSHLSETPDRRIRLGDLAAHMLWSRSRLSHHLARMQQRGLVEREDCADDGRGSVVTLSAQGWAVLVEAAPHHVASVRRNFIDLLTPDEIAALDALSHRVVQRLAETGR